MTLLDRPYRRKDADRMDERFVCKLPARITFCGVFITDCVIKDMSVTGFNAHVPTDKWVPTDFEIGCKHFKQPIKAKMKWRSDQSFGAEFCY